MLDERERRCVAESLEHFRKMHENSKSRDIVRMVPKFYTPKEAERLIKYIEDYPFPFFRGEKSTTAPVSYTKEEAIAWVRKKTRGGQYGC